MTAWQRRQRDARGVIVDEQIVEIRKVVKAREERESLRNEDRVIERKYGLAVK